MPTLNNRGLSDTKIGQPSTYIYLHPTSPQRYR